MTQPDDNPEMDSGNTAFVLVCAALVMVMTPGLAFFYAGMVRARSALNMMMMSMVTLGAVGLIWVLFGFSLAFGESHAGLIGGFGFVGLRVPGVVVVMTWILFRPERRPGLPSGYIARGPHVVAAIAQRLMPAPKTRK